MYPFGLADVVITSSGLLFEELSGFHQQLGRGGPVQYHTRVIWLMADFGHLSNGVVMAASSVAMVPVTRLRSGSGTAKKPNRPSLGRLLP